MPYVQIDSCKECPYFCSIQDEIDDYVYCRCNGPGPGIAFAGAVPTITWIPLESGPDPIQHVHPHCPLAKNWQEVKEHEESI